MGNRRDRPPGAALGGGRRGKGKKKKNGSSPNSLIFPVDLDSTPRAQRAPGRSQKEPGGFVPIQGFGSSALGSPGCSARRGGVGRKTSLSIRICLSSLSWRLPVLQPPSPDPPGHRGTPGSGDVPVPIPAVPSPPLCCQRPAGKFQRVWKREMEQTPKYIEFFFFSLPDLGLEGSRAPDRDAAGKGSGMLAEPRWDLGRGGCTPRGDPRWGGGARPRCGCSRGAGIEFLEPHP